MSQDFPFPCAFRESPYGSPLGPGARTDASASKGIESTHSSSCKVSLALQVFHERQEALATVMRVSAFSALIIDEKALRGKTKTFQPLCLFLNWIDSIVADVKWAQTTLICFEKQRDALCPRENEIFYLLDDLQRKLRQYHDNYSDPQLIPTGNFGMGEIRRERQVQANLDLLGKARRAFESLKANCKQD